MPSHTASLSLSVLSLPSTRSAKRCSLRAVMASLSRTSHRTLLETGVVWAFTFSHFNVLWVFSFFCNNMWTLYHHLPHRRLVGGFLTHSPDYGFVLEDEEGICGYAVGTVDVKPFVNKCKMSWIPFMQEKYNKPDTEKDLSDAEVSMSCLLHQTILFLWNNLLNFQTKSFLPEKYWNFDQVDNLEAFLVSNMLRLEQVYGNFNNFFPIENDAKFPWGGGRLTRIVSQ